MHYVELAITNQHNTGQHTKKYKLVLFPIFWFFKFSFTIIYVFGLSRKLLMHWWCTLIYISMYLKEWNHVSEKVVMFWLTLNNSILMCESIQNVMCWAFASWFWMERPIPLSFWHINFPLDSLNYTFCVMYDLLIH